MKLRLGVTRVQSHSQGGTGLWLEMGLYFLNGFCLPVSSDLQRDGCPRAKEVTDFLSFHAHPSGRPLGPLPSSPDNVKLCYCVDFTLSFCAFETGSQVPKASLELST